MSGIHLALLGMNFGPTETTVEYLVIAGGGGGGYGLGGGGGAGGYRTNLHLCPCPWCRTKTMGLVVAGLRSLLLPLLLGLLTR
jgi:hypothetical protein